MGNRARPRRNTFGIRDDKLHFEETRKHTYFKKEKSSGGRRDVNVQSADQPDRSVILTVVARLLCGLYARG